MLKLHKYYSVAMNSSLIISCASERNWFGKMLVCLCLLLLTTNVNGRPKSFFLNYSAKRDNIYINREIYKYNSCIYILLNFTDVTGTTCPAGTDLFEDHCYIYFRDEEIFTTARDNCRNYHTEAELVSIETENENDYVFALYVKLYFRIVVGFRFSIILS